MNKTIQVTLLAAAAFLLTSCAQTQQQQQQQGRAGEKRYGSSQQQQQQQQQPKAPAPEPAPAPAANSAILRTDLVTLEKSAPAKVALGETFEYVLKYTAHEDLDSLVITDQIGDGLTYVRSEPAATVAERNLVWTLKDVAKGQSGTARIWVKADREGTVGNCATVVAVPQVCVSTFVGKAMISIEKTGPAQAVLGSDVAYSIVVKNSGSMTAKDVVVTDTVPEGLSHSSGQKTLTFNVGELAAGQSRQIPVSLKAATKGRHCNVAQVTSSNAGKANSEACTVVLSPSLKIEKTGTKEQILGRNADYEIVVSNTGDTTLNNVIVRDTAPGETSIVNAPGATVAGNIATWTIAELKPGAKQNATIKLTSKVAGTHCNNVTAAAGALSESARACTLWKGIAAVLLEVVDDPDPIQVGESTTYTIKVTNQGFADIHNAKIVASFARQVTPVTAAQGTISGNTVNFPTVATLGAKQAVTYTVTVRGTSAGDSRNKITLTSTELTSPVEEEESTTVY